MPIASLAEARALAVRHAVRPAGESVPVGAAAGRVIAAEVRAAVRLPGVDVSAMDGYAVRAADTPGRLRPVGESRAGTPFAGALGAGDVVAISTGAAVPAGADAVVRREEARIGADGSVEVPGVAAGRDVRRAGEIIGAGDVLLPAGARVTPASLGTLGAVGAATVTVRARPRVAIVGTGDELVPVGEPLPPGGVYDSNRLGIAAQVEAAGGLVVSSVRVADDREATVAGIAAALSSADMVVTVGGVSVGPHDHVRPAMAALGVTELMAGMRVTPSRPTWLGARDGVPVLALPGNPVASAVAFRLLGPALLGVPDDWPLRATLAAPVTPRPGHIAAVLCRLRDGRAEPLGTQASHAVTSLARADAIALVGAGEPSPGGSAQEVPVVPL